MLAVIDLDAVHLEGRGFPTQETAPLEELDSEPKPLQFEGGAQSGQPAAYNCYTACNHDRSMTDNFSLLLREARCLSGREGSLSMSATIA